jgi:predicted dehydrogenase
VTIASTVKFVPAAGLRRKKLSQCSSNLGRLGWTLVEALKPVTVGIVGAGDIARKVHLPVLQSMGGVQVAWIYDKSEARARQLAAAYAVAALPACTPADLPPTDVILLAVPVEARAAYLDALASGETGVLCEKPFATVSSEHRRISELYPAYRLGCGYMRRFYDSTRTLRHLIAEQWFGRLIRMRIAEGNRSRGSGSDSSFLDSAQPSTSSGVLTDLGSHSIDLAVHLTQGRDFRVRKCELVLDGRIDRRASASVDLVTGAEGAAAVELEYCVSWLDPQPNRLELEFERATVFCGIGPASEVFVGDPRRPAHAFRIVAPVRGASTANQAFYLEWRNFLDGLAAREESLISARSAFLTTALVEALHDRGRATHA